MDFAIGLLVSGAESTIKLGEYVYLILKPEGGTDLQNSFTQLHKYAKDTAVKLKDDLKEIKKDLPYWGVNMDQTIEQVENDIHFFDRSKKSAVKRAREKIIAAEREFQSISEDVSAILLCIKKQHNIKDALQKIKKEPPPSTPPNSIGSRLDKLISDAEKVVKHFENGYPSAQ